MRWKHTSRYGPGAAALVLAMSLAIGGFWPTESKAGDACGVCFRTAVFYWENVEWMKARDVYAWLGTCLDINDC